MYVWIIVVNVYFVKMEKERLRAPRTTSRHHSVMIEFLERHPEMLTRKFKSVNGRQKYNEHWRILTEHLNALGEGSKLTHQWQKVLSDWLSKVKMKAAKNKKYRNGTGGGSPKFDEISEIELRLLQLKGMSCIEGDGINEEAGFGHGSVPEVESMPSSEESPDKETIITAGPSVPVFAGGHQPNKKGSVSNNVSKKRRDEHQSLYLKMHKETLNVLSDISSTLKAVDKNFIEIHKNLHELHRAIVDLTDVVREIIE